MFTKFLLFVGVASCLLVPAGAANAQFTEEFARARVVRIVRTVQDDMPDMTRTVQAVELRILSGADAGEQVELENAILNDRADMRLNAGQSIIMRRVTRDDGSVTWLIAEKYRLPYVAFALSLFFLLCFALGGFTAIRSLLGLLVSVLILTYVVVPGIVAGWSPLLVSLFGSTAIACTSLYLAHGFNRRTSVALASTLITLVLSTLLALFFVWLTMLFGMGSEESMYLQLGSLQTVNLRGLLLGGMVIGCLGVLDDITTAQTAAVFELRRHNPQLSLRALLESGLVIGREHIASLINTLALAYAGASLPLLLLFTVQADTPLWVLMNSEFLTEEIVRTVVGSSALLLAVPISTWLAVLTSHYVAAEKPGSHGHHHHHHHHA